MFARTSMVIIGMVGAFALGLIVGPQIDAQRGDTPAAVVTTAPEAPVVTPAPVNVPRPAASRLERVPPASAPAVKQQVKRLLNTGADLSMAAEGFGNARELMTVAYAARNTEIPFMLLKHRVLKQRMSLASAIQASRPDLDEVAEVNRARAEARADLARMAG